MTNRNTQWLAALIIGVVIISGGSTGWSESSARQHIVRDFHVERFGLYNALRYIAQQTHTVIGLVAVLPSTDQTYKVDVADGTLADVMSALMAEAPNYSWNEDSDGAIRVTGPSAPDLPDLVIAYRGASATRKQIWESLVTIPELNQWLSTHHCAREEIQSGKEFRNNNDPLSIRAANIPLGKLFDEVSGQSGSMFWGLLQNNRAGQCNLSIFLW
jgi:hypothetical protein